MMPTIERRRELLDHEDTSVHQLRQLSDHYLDLVRRRQQLMLRRDHAAGSLAVYGSESSAPWTNPQIRAEVGLSSHSSWNAKSTQRLRETYPLTTAAEPELLSRWSVYGQVPPMANALSVLRAVVQSLVVLDAEIEDARIERDKAMAHVALLFPTTSLAALSAAVGISRQAINLILRDHHIAWSGTERYSTAPVRIRRSRWADL